MSTTAKVLITIAVVFVMIVAGLIAFGVYWFSRHGQELVEQGERVVQEGTEYGKTTDEQGCLDKAIARYKENQGFVGSISAGIFLRTCLDESRPTPGFCDQVPGPTEFFKSSSWQSEQCKQAGISDSHCNQIFGQVQEYCGQKGAR
jgi:hypothetical protein